MENSSNTPIKKHVLNHNFFKTWSHDMAWVLGFFASDGCMSSSQGYKRIDFESADKDVLKKIVKLLDSSTIHLKKYDDRHGWQITFTSEHIYDDLVDLGFTERKSLILQPPKNIPSEYISSFIRGVFDGDGWVSKTQTLHTFGIVSASYDFITWVKHVIETSVGIQSPIYDLIDSAGTYNIVMCGKADWIKFFQWLYQDSTPHNRMERKYHISTNKRWMQCYVIPPITNMSLTHLGNRYFCLAHFYIKYPEYRNFFLSLNKETCFITLDNSAAEKSLVTEDVLLNIVKELKPDEVIAPDVLFNKEATIHNLNSFITKMHENGFLSHTKIFGCPQGSTKEEWLECYTYMLKHSDVSVVGLSKIAVPKCWLNEKEWDSNIELARNECVEYLLQHDMVKKPLHFLGMGDPREYVKYSHIMFRSTDSCYTILAAVNNISFKEGNFTRIKTYDEYYHTSLNTTQRLVARENISFLKQQLRDFTPVKYRSKTKRMDL